MDVRFGLWRRLSTEELMLLNCGVGEDSWESLGLQEIQPVHSEGDQPWDFFGRNDAKSEASSTCEELTHWKRLRCWEGLGAGGERDDRGWDGWMASLTRWTWVWVNSGRWWWTGRPGVLRFMGSQRVGHDWVTELNWTELNYVVFFFFLFNQIPNFYTFGICLSPYNLVLTHIKLSRIIFTMLLFCSVTLGIRCLNCHAYHSTFSMCFIIVEKAKSQ